MSHIVNLGPGDQAFIAWSAGSLNDLARTLITKIRQQGITGDLIFIRPVSRNWPDRFFEIERRSDIGRLGVRCYGRPDQFPSEIAGNLELLQAWEGHSYFEICNEQDIDDAIRVLEYSRRLRHAPVRAAALMVSADETEAQGQDDVE